MDKWNELRRQIRRRIEREERNIRTTADCQYKHLVTAVVLLDVVILMDVLENTDD